MQFFVPYQRRLSILEKVERSLAVVQVASQSAFRYAAMKLKRSSQFRLGASVEITDRCNAGCNYCYVYPPEWDQHDRAKGYLELATSERRSQDDKILTLLKKLKQQGIVYITLVGGEPLLAKPLILEAAHLFPVVWVVSNGTIPFPAMPRSVTWFVSIDGTPDYHNAIRDPKNLFGKQRYKSLTGMTARIAQTIDESDRGAYIHVTLTKPSLPHFRETVDWLVGNITKLRGIVVSGAATDTVTDPNTLTLGDRLVIKSLIEEAAQVYGWDLFPANQPKTNEFLFNPEHLITDPAQCVVARRVDSYNFNGESVGKCVLRDADCQTCVCNVSGMTRSVRSGDWESIRGILRTGLG
ncbi:MAG: radical SAM protein [Leptolyngbya sp.]|nr:MAG: radical SAM protein [Leptolyngbya sp.]